MRVRVVLLVIGALTAGTVAYLVRHRWQTDPDASQPESAAREPAQPYRPTPVALNRGAEVLDGFRGDVHPLLSGQTRLEVTAHWAAVGLGRDQLHRAVPPS